MPKKNSYITVTDQFCGAGGSSQGVRMLAKRHKGGIEVKMALNHWKLAIETHSTNFPETMHDCTDVSACDPRRYPSTDILITSPECTTHSPAGGNNHKTLKKQMDLFETGKIDPATERSRATMWDVCRFAEYHQYNCIIVENVVEAKTRWALFDVWLTAMHTLGYNHRCVYLNSMHCHPTPQSRDRMYVVFWKKGNKAPMLDYTPTSWCSKCQRNIEAVQTWKSHQKQFGKYRQQYVYACPSCTNVVEPYYYASMNVIDWSDIGQRIGERKKPLSPKSIARIEYGRKKYGSQPLQVMVGYGAEARGTCRSAFEPGYSQTTSGTTAFVHPFFINDQHSSGVDFRVRSVTEKLTTIQTTHQLKMIVPFLVKLEHSHAQSSGNVKSIIDQMQTVTCRHSQMLITGARSTAEAMTTQTTAQASGLVTPPFMIVAKGKSKAKASTDPLTTQTGMINHGIVTDETWNHFITQYYGGSNCTKHITEELGSVTCVDRSALVSYKEPSLEDCYYRMLKPREIKLGMAFETDYVILGNSRDQVKQCGNAVTPPAMAWLVQQCVESLR